MGLEIVYFVGAIILLAALVYGVISFRHRNRAAVHAGEKVVRERYRANDS